MVAAAFFQGKYTVLVVAVPTMGAAVQLKEGGVADEPGFFQFPGDGGGAAALRNGDIDGFAGLFAAVNLTFYGKNADDDKNDEHQQDHKSGPAFFVFFIGHSIKAPVFFSQIRGVSVCLL